MLNATLLDNLASRIESKLQAVNCPVLIQGSRVLPQFVEFEAVPLQSTTFRDVAMRSADIAIAIGVKSSRITHNRDIIAIQVPLSSHRRTIKLSNIVQSSHFIPVPYVATLGQHENGAILKVNLKSSTVAHVLISGTTGSGKTELAHSFLASLSLTAPHHQLGFIIIDPKHNPSSTFTRFISTHLDRPPAATLHDSISLLRDITALIDSRSPSAFNSHTIVIYVDEMADLCAMGGPDIINALTRIVARGREIGIHLVGCTQKPTARSLDTIMKANFPFRIALRVMSQDDARVALGFSASGAESLLGNGDAIAAFAGSHARFQSALFDLLPPELQNSPATDLFSTSTPSDALTAPSASPTPNFSGQITPLYSPADTSDALQVAIAATLNANPAISSLRQLQAHLSTPSGKSYSGGANYNLIVTAAKACGFSGRA